MARFDDTVDLPTPPLPENTAMMFFTPGKIGVDLGFGAARPRDDQRPAGVEPREIDGL
jgi:hypothetical protein